MSIQVKGKEIRNVNVDIDPLDVVDVLYREAFKLLNKTEDRGLVYDYSSFIIDEKGRIIEVYINEGYDYGHYQKDDEEVYRMDRSHKYDKDFLDYIVGLDKVSNYLRSNGYE